MSGFKTGGFLTLLIFLVLVTTASTTTKYWVHWLSVTIMCAILFVVDMIFEGSSFVFDPFMDLKKL